MQFKGGLAVEFPTISVHESFSSPTSMFLRNLMAMDTEEMVRAQPVDGVVMIGGGFSILSSFIFVFNFDSYERIMSLTVLRM